jgi:uncharacterized lipoprotein YmbA
MMKVIRPLNKIHLIILVLVSVVLGCGASSLPVTYYILNPMDYQASNAPRYVAEALVLGIGPIQLPAYLDRLQMVTRTGANRLKVDDFHRWAAPLPGEISRILADNLEQLTGIQRYEIYPWAFQQQPDLAVELEIRAFEGQSDGSVILDGTMVFYDWRNTQPKSRSRTFHITQNTAAGDYAAMVAAQSRSLTELSRQIGDDILVLISK